MGERTLDSRLALVDGILRDAFFSPLGLHDWLAFCFGQPALLGLEEEEAFDLMVRAAIVAETMDPAAAEGRQPLAWLWGAEGKRQILAHKMRAIDRLYDYVLLDFSPSASIISESGLRYTRDLIVPVSMTYLALVGTRQVIETLRTVGRVPGHNVRLYLTVPTFYSPKVRQDREVLGILHRHFAERVTEPIRTNVKLTEAPSHHKTIFEYSPRSSAAADYRQLVERVLRDS